MSLTFRKCFFSVRRINWLSDPLYLNLCKLSSFSRKWNHCAHVRSFSSKKKPISINSLVQPLFVKPYCDPENVGEQIAGKLKKEDILKLLNTFYRLSEVRDAASDHGIDEQLFHKVFVSFRRFCIDSGEVPVDLHISLSDILAKADDVSSILPYFIKHAKVVFPHLECIEDLEKISDLRHPANWYCEARAIQRKIIYHAGPTNSGKTYHALKSFLQSKSGIYCGPLRLLAAEVYNKANAAGTPCDLITGEERRYVSIDKEPSNHLACTIEMSSIVNPYEIAVIDEIQMVRDLQRGWAWTRAFLGIVADEVHVCGEASAIELLQGFAEDIGDEFEVRHYERLTPLNILTTAVETFDNVEKGDCIVCFSKKDVYFTSRSLERRGIMPAVIYGSLPPGTKLAQAAKFNDPNDPCKVMVSTDAIGMGLNLNIKRIILYSLTKPHVNMKGERVIDLISPSTAKQICGRAGRYGTDFGIGEATSFKKSDIINLQNILASEVEAIDKVGLQPTAEQIELFAYHLPNATLSNLIDIFVSITTLDNNRYFLCSFEDFKFIADMIDHIPLSLRDRYVFCRAPIPKRQPFVCTLLLKFARQYSKAEPITAEWIIRQLNWPFSPARIIRDLEHMESVFDVLDLYLWLSYRFEDMFPDIDHVRKMAKELDTIIQEGIHNITRLLKNAESVSSVGIFYNNDIDENVSDKIGLNRKSKTSKSFEISHGNLHIDMNKSISKQLLEKGLLDKEMLAKLKEEQNTTKNSSRKSRTKRKKR